MQVVKIKQALFVSDGVGGSPSVAIIDTARTNTLARARTRKPTHELVHSYTHTGNHKDARAHSRTGVLGSIIGNVLFLRCAVIAKDHVCVDLSDSDPLAMPIYLQISTDVFAPIHLVSLP